MFSPSPFTIIQWVVLSLVGMILLRRHYGIVKSKRLLYYFSTAAFTLGFTVLLSDAVWIIFQYFKWGASFPESIFQLQLSLVRDLAGVVMCIIFMMPVLDFVNVNRYTILFWVGNLVFFACWYIWSVDPSFTDWTFAYKYGYGLNHTWNVFVISHIYGRIITGAIYLSMWMKK